ncbi:hypothetical protein B1218_36535, partial [Pseudomonas ogarae]
MGGRWDCWGEWLVLFGRAAGTGRQGRVGGGGRGSGEGSQAVLTGWGGSGKGCVCQEGGVVQDVLSLAKGLGEGVRIGACLARGKAAELFTPGGHGSTFGGKPRACRVGCTVLE